MATGFILALLGVVITTLYQHYQQSRKPVDYVATAVNEDGTTVTIAQGRATLKNALIEIRKVTSDPKVRIKYTKVK